jgi:hypothetical protein
MVIRTVAGIGICISIGIIIGMVIAWLEHLHKNDDN